MRLSFAPLFFVAVALTGETARAEEPTFAATDIATVFFISKSNDRNRVDYGIRLTAACAPSKDEAVFPYWREFENSPPVRIHTLGMFEWVPYGFSEQRMLLRTPQGGKHFVKLKQFNRPITIVTTKEADGHCTAKAYATIGGVEGAELVSIYAKLAGAMSVDYIDIHGKNPTTGQVIDERVKK